jgi:ZIP family zinc transporter
MQELSPVLQAFIATSFTWLMTALGAALVFVTHSMNRRILDGTLGFAAGVMIAASFWSLLKPAIEMAEDQPVPAWLPAAVGFLLGGGFLRLLDSILPHLHLGFPLQEAEGIKTHWQRSVLLILAITLHNIPEGLAVGVAFGAVDAGLPGADFPGAVALAVGIGLQNFPEGLAVSMPLRREGFSRLRSFWYGQLSALVEPLAGIVGAAVVMTSRALLPYALSFAAGAMMFVVVEQVVPESQRGGHADLVTLCSMVGFTVMMILDVAFS